MWDESAKLKYGKSSSVAASYNFNSTHKFLLQNSTGITSYRSVRDAILFCVEFGRRLRKGFNCGIGQMAILAGSFNLPRDICHQSWTKPLQNSSKVSFMVLDCCA